MSNQTVQFSNMVNEIVDYAILTMDQNGYVQNWNAGASRIKGYTADEIVGKNFKIFYTDDDLIDGKPQTLLNKAILEGRATDEGWRRKKDGTLFWASVVITAIHDDEDNIVGFTKVTRDLTERRNSELAMQEQTNSLINKNRELEQFAYIASHDLQEPLRTILNCSDILSRAYGDKLDDNGKKLLNFISDASGRMSQLIKGLLDYSRLGKESQLAEVDCNKLLEDIQNDLSVRIEESSAKILKGNLPTIRAYEVELRALMQNLISNAIKFKHPESFPVVRIVSQRVDEGWQFSIKDNGIGIAEENLTKVFKIFQRIHTRDKYEGHGIGLAHCLKIAELHKGKIWAESVLGEGTTFHFTVNTI